MPTKSFFKTINITDEESASNLVKALSESEAISNTAIKFKNKPEVLTGNALKDFSIQYDRQHLKKL